MMIDLHIHSTYSDGTDNIIDILKQAENLNLDIISITDHESCDAYQEINKIDVRKYFSGKIITGIELKTQYNDGIVDILGYNINCDKMKNYLSECYKKISREKIQEKKLEEFYKYGEQYGLILRPIQELIWDKKKDWGSIVFYNEMKSHEENKSKVPADLWESFKNFKQNYYKIKGKMFYVNMSKDYPTFDEIISIIHNSGGLAFIAHIYEYTWMEDKLNELKLMGEKLDGVECYHSSFTEEQIEKLIQFSKENNLLMSGGSDYHGTNKPYINLGTGQGILKVPKNIIENWQI
ncbi:MAG: PHP domain-containing protein [Clostridia bacterium]|nr:PHP domain-containing protein [Clostridia bacterium]